jgi:hypothetical protein
MRLAAPILKTAVERITRKTRGDDVSSRRYSSSNAAARAELTPSTISLTAGRRPGDIGTPKVDEVRYELHPSYRHSHSRARTRSGFSTFPPSPRSKSQPAYWLSPPFSLQLSAPATWLHGLPISTVSGSAPSSNESSGAFRSLLPSQPSPRSSSASFFPLPG